MKTTGIIATAVGACLLAMAASAVAVDYSAMTTEELSGLRGTMYNATQEERDAFRTEWLTRVEKMSQDERQTYLGSGSGLGQGKRGGSGLGDGSGRGKGGGGKGGGKGGGGQGRAGQ